jgi:hypothetical protein
VTDDESAFFNSLNGVRFTTDVAVSSEGVYLFETEAIDATISVDGPEAEDGILHVTGVFSGFTHEATVFQIEGEIGGRRVVATVPAT